MLATLMTIALEARTETKRSVDSALDVRSVTKRFGDFVAVDAISFTVPRGTTCGFLGPNGSGKTTTIRMVMNITRPDTGEIAVLGEPAGEVVKKRVGYLPEEKGLYKKMKVREQLAYFGALKGLADKAALRRADELMDEFGLGEWKARRSDELSKGMQQKVQFLGASIHDPELLILDEPFSGLDPVNAEVLKDAILLYRKRGKTIVFSTHVMEHAEKLCDSIVLVNKGKKVLDGTLAAVKAGAGREAVFVRYDGDGSVFSSLPMVKRANDYGKHAEIELRDGASPQDLLRAIVSRVEVRSFESREPSLHEIFVKKVGENGGA